MHGSTLQKRFLWVVGFFWCFEGGGIGLKNIYWSNLKVGLTTLLNILLTLDWVVQTFNFPRRLKYLYEKNCHYFKKSILVTETPFKTNGKQNRGVLGEANVGRGCRGV